MQPGAKDVYIVTAGVTQIQFTPDKRTPLEAIENGCGLSLLTFTRVHRVFQADCEIMFEKCAYVPAEQ